MLSKKYVGQEITTSHKSHHWNSCTLATCHFTKQETSTRYHLTSSTQLRPLSTPISIVLQLGMSYYCLIVNYYLVRHMGPRNAYLKRIRVCVLRIPIRNLP